MSAAEARTIREQYGMAGEALELPLRRCQVVYFLKRYQLEEPISLRLLTRRRWCS